jgi:thioredoxin 1
LTLNQKYLEYMPTKAITDESFDSDVIKSNKPTVVDFWAEWCGPCKQIGPVLEEISEEMKDQVVIAKHNIDQEPNTPTKYGIKGIPTMLLFKGGELKATKVGATTKSNIVSWIKENI